MGKPIETFPDEPIETFPDEPVAETPPTFVSIDVAELPKRNPPRGRAFDSETAELLFGMVTESIGAKGASDGIAYDAMKDARSASNKARRMIARVGEDRMPEGYAIFAKVHGSGEDHTEPPFRWSVFLAEGKPRKKRTAAAVADDATLTVITDDMIIP